MTKRGTQRVVHFVHSVHQVHQVHPAPSLIHTLSAPAKTGKVALFLRNKVPSL
jgi:hypothetical protein